MISEIDKWIFTLVYQVCSEEHVETFYTEDQMKRFIAENNVRPLFHYVEKETKK